MSEAGRVGIVTDQGYVLSQGVSAQLWTVVQAGILTSMARFSSF